MALKRIPLFRPIQPGKDAIWKYFQRSIDAGQLSNIGPCYLEAQARIEARATFNCLVANATLGLELAIRASYPPRARIAVPSNTFKATYLATVNAGMVPVIYNEIIPTDVSGLIAVAPYGWEIKFGEYDALPFPVVYDLAGAWGQYYKGPNLAVYSFHATKRIPVGEGGCVVSSNLEKIEKIKWMANFNHTNAKLSEIQCAVLLALLDMKATGFTADYMKNNEFGASLSMARVWPEAIYKITNNHEFVAKRYYYPLLEDLYSEAIVSDPTPKKHWTRQMVALPRDVTGDEFKIVNDVVSSYLSESHSILPGCRSIYYPAQSGVEEQSTP